jgi:hypothetical protein
VLALGGIEALDVLTDLRQLVTNWQQDAGLGDQPIR